MKARMPKPSARIRQGGTSRPSSRMIKPPVDDRPRPRPLQTARLLRADVRAAENQPTIAARYDQRAETFPGIAYIASAKYWLTFVHETQSACVPSQSKEIAGMRNLARHIRCKADQCQSTTRASPSCASSAASGMLVQPPYDVTE